jgi:hypothetical protein
MRLFPSIRQCSAEGSKAGPASALASAGDTLRDCSSSNPSLHAAALPIWTGCDSHQPPRLELGVFSGLAAAGLRVSVRSPVRARRDVFGQSAAGAGPAGFLVARGLPDDRDLAFQDRQGEPSRLVTLGRVLVLAARQMKPEVKLLLSLALVTLVANLGAWYYRRAAASELQANAAEGERGLLRMTALCRAGKGEEARAEAADFLRRYPSSPLRSRVLAACPGRP